MRLGGEQGSIFAADKRQVELGPPT
jgi:hypothetical protein